jgi:GNAT superfamily N-acetyltransferase
MDRFGETAIRIAEAGDVEAILAIDRQVLSGVADKANNAEESDGRQRALRRSVEAGECAVAVADGAVIAGYAIWHDRFFHARMIELLVVASALRRRGIGGDLLDFLVRHCPTPKIWTSTNLSNTPMQRLLATRGFQLSGFIEGLDEGDPELVYRREVATTAGTTPG